MLAFSPQASLLWITFLPLTQESITFSTSVSKWQRWEIWLRFRRLQKVICGFDLRAMNCEEQSTRLWSHGPRHGEWDVTSLTELERTTKSAVSINDIHSSLYLFSSYLLSSYLSGNTEITRNKWCAGQTSLPWEGHSAVRESTSQTLRETMR